MNQNIINQGTNPVRCMFFQFLNALESLCGLFYSSDGLAYMDFEVILNPKLFLLNSISLGWTIETSYLCPLLNAFWID